MSRYPSVPLVILFEMLTARRPFPGTDALAVAMARLVDHAPDPRTFRALPDSLVGVVRRCMARQPGDRYRDGSELVAVLSSLGSVASLPVSAHAVPIVPEKSARSVAILPFRAPDDLVDVAEGLGEEIVDTLSMSRGLRVRPLASLRATARDADPRSVGAQHGVDVVIEGSLRKRGTTIRLAARLISVADGFQLWANQIDCAPAGLLAASDELVRAIAGALTVEIVIPERPALDGRLAELYLQAKAQLRSSWIEGAVSSVIADLDRALPDAPNDPGIAAVLSMALARSGFFGSRSDLERARVLATRAVELAPSSGEAWLALGFSTLYSGDGPAAARAFARAVRAAPGLATAQAMFGSMLLEAGELDDSIAHLEAAVSIDPAMLQTTDLARAYAYRGQDAEAVALLRGHAHQFTEYLIARLKLWRGEHYAFSVKRNKLSPLQFRLATISERSYAVGIITDEDLASYEDILQQVPRRYRASQAQYLAEFLAYMRRPDDVMRIMAMSVDAGLHDALWVDRCPLLDPLRERPDFTALANVVRERAQAIIAAVRDATA